MQSNLHSNSSDRCSLLKASVCDVAHFKDLNTFNYFIYNFISSSLNRCTRLHRPRHTHHHRRQIQLWSGPSDVIADFAAAIQRLRPRHRPVLRPSSSQRDHLRRVRQRPRASVLPCQLPRLPGHGPQSAGPLRRQPVSRHRRQPLSGITTVANHHLIAANYYAAWTFTIVLLRTRKTWSKLLIKNSLQLKNCVLSTVLTSHI